MKRIVCAASCVLIVIYPHTAARGILARAMPWRGSASDTVAPPPAPATSASGSSTSAAAACIAATTAGASAPAPSALGDPIRSQAVYALAWVSSIRATVGPAAAAAAGAPVKPEIHRVGP